MKFISDNVEWNGFQKMSTSALQHTLLVIAWFDGEPELWNCDGDDGVESLRRYYRNDWGDRDIPFTISVITGKENVCVT